MSSIWPSPEEAAHREGIAHQLPAWFSQITIKRVLKGKERTLYLGQIALWELTKFTLTPSEMEASIAQLKQSKDFVTDRNLCWGLWIASQNPTFSVLCLEDPGLYLRLFELALDSMHDLFGKACPKGVTGQRTWIRRNDSKHTIQWTIWKGMMRSRAALIPDSLRAPYDALQTWKVTERLTFLLDWSQVLIDYDLPDLPHCLSQGLLGSPSGPRPDPNAYAAP